MNHILDLKLKLEEQEKISYGNARRKLLEEESTLQAYEDRKREYEDCYRKQLQTTMNLQEIRRYQRAIEDMKTLIIRQKAAVNIAEKTLEVTRIRLNKAMMERKTYEVLKEKAFEDFLKEIDRAEQKEIDELVSFKFNDPTSYEEET